MDRFTAELKMQAIARAAFGRFATAVDVRELPYEINTVVFRDSTSEYLDAVERWVGSNARRTSVTVQFQISDESLNQLYEATK
jgi:hypothetical protein